MTAIDDLPTEAMREAARRIERVLEQLSPESRAAVLRRHQERLDGEAKLKALRTAVKTRELINKIDRVIDDETPLE